MKDDKIPQIVVEKIRNYQDPEIRQMQFGQVFHQTKDDPGYLKNTFLTRSH